MFWAGLAPAEEIDFDQAIHLDAENLAEGGIGEAYANLKSSMRSHGVEPVGIEEIREPLSLHYLIRALGREFVIYDKLSDVTEESNSDIWLRSAVVLFEIVNSQLDKSKVRFYALNSGNDLMGVFLTPADAQEARNSLPKRTDWPYLPDGNDAEWGGQYH